MRWRAPRGSFPSLSESRPGRGSQLFGALGAARVDGRGKADVDFEATAGSGVCGDDRVVGVGDGLDDRQAQPDTVSAASGLRAESLEGLKEAREFVGRDEPARVG